ncbi:40S ribosomal protein S13 [Iris pallida]|uniref:40S ribosomal protein S13 n=1 Tax=Iris pallida TaxID=29817 RepID=A0AAX6G0T9_IRIPA|nr:40S ribosomal protein S13 [Iris pallida]
MISGLESSFGGREYGYFIWLLVKTWDMFFVDMRLMNVLQQMLF